MEHDQAKRGKKNVKTKKVDGKKVEYVKMTPEIKAALKFLKACRGMNEHHIVPVERGGKNGNGNKKIIAGKIHALLHDLCGNLTPEEIGFFLEFLLRGRKKRWKLKEVETLRQLILEGDLEEAMNLSQFGRKQQDVLAEKFLSIINKRKVKKC